MCAPIKLNFLFYKRKPVFDALSNVFKFTFSLSDVFVVTVITRNRISGVGSLFFNDRILRFGKNLPQSLKRFLSNFNIVGIQNSLDGFHNTLNVGNNNTTSRWFPFIRSATGTGVLLGKPATGCVVIPYIQGVMEPIKRFPCNDCDNEYIRQTKRKFATHWKEHQKAVFLGKKENSALSEHTC